MYQAHTEDAFNARLKPRKRIFIRCI